MMHYQDISYVDKNRFSSFFYQLSEVLAFNPASAVEIGIGSGILRDILVGRNIKVFTLDIEKRLGPSVITSITNNLPLESYSVDVVICCQVLEHIEFSFFEQAIGEIVRISRHGAVISLPNVEPFYFCHAALPLLGEVTFAKTINRPWYFSDKNMNSSHRWEIGREGITTSKISNLIEKNGACVQKVYRNSDYGYHQFFVLRRTE